MKRLLLRALISNTIWCTLTLFVGWYVGSHFGYARGARDVAKLVLELRDAAVALPEPYTKGDI